jgi:CrcB protein
MIGAVGALLRVTLDARVERRSTGRFPMGTLVVNLSGTIGLGFIHGLGVGGNTALLVGMAGLGSYTTFSTLIFETERLVEEGDGILAAANMFGSMVLGLDAVIIGWVIGRAM